MGRGKERDREKEGIDEKEDTDGNGRKQEMALANKQGMVWYRHLPCDIGRAKS